MQRFRRVLVLLALAGWFGAFVSHVVAVGCADRETRSRRKVTRNQFLLLSSVCLNTLCLHAIYRYAKRFLE